MTSEPGAGEPREGLFRVHSGAFSVDVPGYGARDALVRLYGPRATGASPDSARKAVQFWTINRPGYAPRKVVVVRLRGGRDPAGVSVRQTQPRPRSVCSKALGELRRLDLVEGFASELPPSWRPRRRAG